MTALQEFAAAPIRARIWVAASIPFGILLSLLLSTWPSPTISTADVIIAMALVAGSVVNVELGRLLEGGTVAAQRPHKALSAWPMAAAILVPSFYLAPIIALIYVHARWRGMRVALWKWVGSASFLTAAGAIAGVVVAAGGGGAPLTLTSGLPGLLCILGAIGAFLLIESAMLGVTALTNTAHDEVWLRKTLTDPWFYLTEAGVLTVGALTGLLGANAPWFVMLMVPAYWFLQQSVLHRPLQELVDHDPKTGLLHYNAWHRQATDEIRRLSAASGSWAVLFADIDHFRFYNQRHGHLGGDEALELVARIIANRIRPKDIVARFGGEEFCVLLPETTSDAAAQIAERVRVAVGNETSVLPESVTVSIGVAAVDGGALPTELAIVLALADQALYQAKLEGRNTVRIRLPASPESTFPLDREDPAQARRDLA